MSLEESISELSGAILELKDEVEHLSRLMEMAQGIEAGELEMEGPGYAENTPYEGSIHAGPQVVSSMSPESPSEIEGTSSHTIELIKLAKEMGYEYIQNGDQLVVDNRVLDEYNRRNLKDNLG